MNIVAAKYTRELDEPSNEVLARYLRRFLTAELLPFNATEVEQSVAGYGPFVAAETENAATHLQEFLRQLIQHNIRTIQQYYSRIRL